MDSNTEEMVSSIMTVVVPPIDPKNDKSWIRITLTGSSAGDAVADMTFKATAKSAGALATGVGFTMEMLGSVASFGAKYLRGESAASSVRVVTQSAARTTEESVAQTGIATAGVAAAVAGATTALTLTAGTRLIEYSVEYGGKITRDMAEKFSEMYLQYRAMHTGFMVTGDVNQLIDSEWVMIGETGRQTLVSSDPPAGPIALPSVTLSGGAASSGTSSSTLSALVQTTPSKKRKGMVIVHTVPNLADGAPKSPVTPKPELKLQDL